MDESESLDYESDKSCFFGFQRFLFLSRFFLFDLLELVSFNELDSFDGESDDDGSGSGSAGTCAFPVCSDESIGSVGRSVGHVSGVGSGVFVLTGIKSIGDVFPLVVFVPKIVESKGSRLIEIFCRPKS